MGSCDTLFEDYFKWASQQDLTKGKAMVDCVVVSNQADNVVSYATGVLVYTPGKVMLDQVIPDLFGGELIQHVSVGGDSGNNSFDPQRSDKISLVIKGSGGIVPHLSPPQVVITLLSHDNDSFHFELQCLAGVIYGVGNPVDSNAANALYVVSISNKHYIAND